MVLDHRGEILFAENRGSAAQLAAKTPNATIPKQVTFEKTLICFIVC